MKRMIMLGMVVAALGGPAFAKDRTNGAESPLLKNLAACRAIAADVERLRCFDLAAGQVQAAVDRKAIYVVERSQVQQTRKSLFGLPLPRLGIFGDGNDDEAKIDRIDTVLKNASANGDGNYLFTLEDGSVWRQIDGLAMGITPKRGAKITVKRAALGSYKLSVDGHSAVRVRRSL